MQNRTGCKNLLEYLGMDICIQRIVASSGSRGGQDLKIKLQEMLDGREDIALVSYVDLKRELEEKKNMISAISHGFLLVLFLIVVFNLVNMTFTNVLSRKKELGILEVIGLTLQQYCGFCNGSLSTGAVACWRSNP